MAWQDTIAVGSTDTTEGLSGGLTIMAKLTISGGGTCDKVRFWQEDPTSTGALCKMALYDNSSPKNLLGSASAVGALPGATGYIESTLSVAVTGLTNGQVVWIALSGDTDAAFDNRYLNGGASNTSYKFEAYSGFPGATFTEDGTLTRTYAASANIEAAGGFVPSPNLFRHMTGGMQE